MNLLYGRMYSLFRKKVYCELSVSNLFIKVIDESCTTTRLPVSELYTRHFAYQIYWLLFSWKALKK